MKTIYLIKDLSRATGHSIYTLKYYLQIGLLKEIGRSPETNFRYFDDSTIDRLKEIRKLRMEGYSLRKIDERLNNHS